MKVFGFDDTDVIRGELQAAEIEALDLHFFEATCAGLGWEFMSTRFAEARGELVTRMRAEGIDEEMIRAVRGLKASWVPIGGECQ